MRAVPVLLAALAFALFTMGCPSKAPAPGNGGKTPAPATAKAVPKGAPTKPDGTLDVEALQKLAFIDALRVHAWDGHDFVWGAALPDDPKLHQTPVFNPAIPIPDVAIQPQKYLLDPPKPPPAPDVAGNAADPSGKMPPNQTKPDIPHKIPVQKIVDPAVDWAPMAIPPGPKAFTTKSFTYVSEGLKIGGFGAIPEGTDKKPMVILIHGYVPADRYTSDNLRREAEYLAARDYLALVPDLRNYGSSDKVDANEEIRRLGYLRDVLNLMQVANSGAIPEGEPGNLAMWGFGHGGDLALKATLINGTPKAVMLISSTGLQLALDHDIFRQSMAPEAAAGMDALYGPPGPDTDAWYHSMTASNFLNRLGCPIAMVNGELDPIIPIDRPRGLLSILTPMGIQSQFNSLPYTGHNYYGQDWLGLMSITDSFLQQRLRPKKAG